jgi:hypothetical protein
LSSTPKTLINKAKRGLLEHQKIEILLNKAYICRMAASTYLKTLKQRGADSRVYEKHQLIGLELAKLLGDEKHKSLYIKLAKQYGGDRLMQIAKDVADRKEVKNKGAYFMTAMRGDLQKSIPNKKNGS